jgi:hypothetical protein
MSKAFVQGLPRPSMPKPPEVPGGYVKAVWHGRPGARWSRPIPYTDYNFPRETHENWLQANADGQYLMTVDEFAYFEKVAPGAFTKVQSQESEDKGD